MQREKEVCTLWETARSSTSDSQRLNKVWALFEGKKVTKGVCNVAKFAGAREQGVLRVLQHPLFFSVGNCKLL